MSDNRFVWSGLDELRRDLLALPDHLAAEAMAVIEDTAAAAEADIASGYAAHRRSGTLGSKLRRKVTRDGVSVIAKLTNTSPIAQVFENGSQARHTDIGANRGSMPPAHVFVPVMQRHRRRMYERLKGVIAKAGPFEVSGDA